MRCTHAQPMRSDNVAPRRDTYSKFFGPSLYAPRISILSARSLCKIGLFFARVCSPSQAPRFLKSVRSEDDDESVIFRLCCKCDTVFVN